MKSFALVFQPLAFLLTLCAASLLYAQTVQLPTFEHFDVSTTVSVPDRGAAYMGGIQRAASGGSERGTPILPFRNRSFGSDMSASGVQTSVYIHDFEAMDEEILNSPSGTNLGARRNFRLGPDKMRLPDDRLLRRIEEREVQENRLRAAAYPKKTQPRVKSRAKKDELRADLTFE
ncbi:MAG: hypothetical protein Q4D38_11855 [Planctomycetia bacterium]|nr:hypothetical protein [Planctomycetia bacterium]